MAKTGPKPKPLIECVSMEPNSGCWLWERDINNKGYADIIFYINGKRKHFLVHRLMYEMFKGEIPTGLSLDHLCRTPCCVNPWHLEAVNHKVNVLRGMSLPAINSRKTHCHKGHGFDDKNTRTNTNGQRVCRICDNIRSMKYKLDNPDKVRESMIKTDAKRRDKRNGILNGD